MPVAIVASPSSLNATVTIRGTAVPALLVEGTTIESSAVGGFVLKASGGGPLELAVGAGGSVVALHVEPSGRMGINMTAPGHINATDFFDVVPLHVRRTGSGSSYVLSEHGSAGGYLINDTSRVMDQRLWAFETNGGQFMVRSYLDNGSPTSRFVLDRVGSAVLGQTIPAWGGGFRALTVNNDASLVSTGAGSADLARNLYQDGAVWRLIRNDTAEVIDFSGGVVTWSTAPAGAIGSAAVLTTRMTLNASGLTVVGAIAAGANATVTGVTILTSSTTVQVPLVTRPVSTAGIGGLTQQDAGGVARGYHLYYGPAYVGNNSFGVAAASTGELSASGDLYVGTYGAASLVLGTSALPRLTISPTGATSLGGNLVFTGVGARIQGDFSNAAHANRVLVQTSTVNGNTTLGVLPNGTAVSTAVTIYTGADPANAGTFSLSATGGGVATVATSRFGTGAEPTAINLGSALGTIVALATATGLVTHTYATVLTGATSLGNNLTFTGVGARITADFSSGTHANRTLLQTSTVNANTVVGMLPNGTGTAASLLLYALSDTVNTPTLSLTAVSTGAQLNSGAFGTGVAQPLSFIVAGTTVARLHASGGVSILDATDPGAAVLRVAGRLIIPVNAVGAPGSLYKDAAGGLVVWGITGSSNDFTLLNNTGLGVFSVPASTQNVNFGANIALVGTTAAWGSSYRSVTVLNEGMLASSDANLILSRNLYHDGSTWRLKAADAGESIQLNNGTFYFQASPTGSALSVASQLGTRMQLGLDGLTVGGGVLPAWQTPNTKTLMLNTTGFLSGRGDALWLTRNVYYDGATWRTRIADTGEVIQMYSRAITFYGVNSAGIDGSTALSQFAAIDTNGLGVGGATLATASAIINAVRSQNLATQLTVTNTTTGASAYAGANFQSDNAGSLLLAACSTSYGAPFAGKAVIQSNHANGLILQNNNGGQIQFYTGSGGAQLSWFVHNSGHWYPGTDNGWDIGATASNRPRSIFAFNAFNTSHSKYKRDWRPLAAAEALAVARSTEVGTYRMRPSGVDAGVAHWTRVGLLADQAHPYLSPDGEHVSPQDTACLALAAIRALAEENARLAERLARLEAAPA